MEARGKNVSDGKTRKRRKQLLDDLKGVRREQAFEEAKEMS